MASILDRYGIKEVCDLWFYEINEDGTRGNPVLYIDTAKTSSVEQSAESSIVFSACILALQNSSWNASSLPVVSDLIYVEPTT